MVNKALFKESLLHFIWRFRLFNQLNLQTTEGDLVIVEDVGQHHQNAGPDFEFARIREATWAGSVEIHIHEEDWMKHGHQKDKRYDTVVLHVVWAKSKNLAFRTDNSLIPTLVLKQYVDPLMLEKYAMLMENLDWIPC